MTEYVLDTSSAAAVVEHDALAQLLDPFSRMRIEQVAPHMDSWVCLEVGPGRHGTIARWLADRVGPQGQVVAADLRADCLPHHPGVRPVVHDITSPEPVGGIYQYELIHARLVLMHLPTRREVLRRLAGMLAPGGVLLIEDWAPRRRDWVLTAPDEESADLFGRVQHALGAVFDRGGVDPQWGTQIHQAMLEEGLSQVDTAIHDAYWSPGHPGLIKLGTTLTQLEPRLRQAGVTDTDLTQVRDLLNHPGLIVRGHPLYSTSGRRAA